MIVIQTEKHYLRRPVEPGCRVKLEWPRIELYQKEHEIPRVRVPVEVRPPVSCPRLMVSVKKPDGEYSERRAEIDDWGNSFAALIIKTEEDEIIPLGSDVEMLRYEI